MDDLLRKEMRLCKPEAEGIVRIEALFVPLYRSKQVECGAPKLHRNDTLDDAYDIVSVDIAGHTVCWETFPGSVFSSNSVISHQPAEAEDDRIGKCVLEEPFRTSLPL